MAKKPYSEAEIAADSGAWGRFERTVDKMLHTPPKPHKPKERPASKGRVRKGKSRA